MENHIQWNVASSDDFEDDTSVNDMNSVRPAVLESLADEATTLDINDAPPFAAESSTSSHPPVQEQPPHQSIVIVNAQKQMDKAQDAFVSYHLKSNTTNVRRRFRDFAWLSTALNKQYPACFIPPLPERHRMEYVKGDRFSADFIEKRRVRLERFLQRIERHPVLRQSKHFANFLSSTEFNASAATRALNDGQDTMIDTIGDSFLNAFSKIRQPDPLFIDMGNRAQTAQTNLESLEKTLVRTNKRTEDLNRDYDELAESMRGLADLETGMRDSMLRFAEGVDQYAEQIKIMVTHDTDWLAEIHDYMAYYNAMKSVLKLRDLKQLDFEELTEYLQSSEMDRKKLVQSRADSYNLTGFLAGKINEARGADMEKLRREKVLKLDERIRELREAVDQANHVSSAFSDQIQKEDDFFAYNKAMEMHYSLQTYTSAKVDFYERGADAWRQVVQALEEHEQASEC